MAEDRAADDWWGGLSAARRAQIHRWVSGGGHGPPPDEADALFPVEAARA